MPAYTRAFAIELDDALGKLDPTGIVGSCLIDDRLQVLGDGWSGFQLLPDSNIRISKICPCPFHGFCTHVVMLIGREKIRNGSRSPASPAAASQRRATPRGSRGRGRA